jgi:F-type H+-transporting ATPase subunit c
MEGIYAAKVAAFVGAAFVMAIGSMAPAYGQAMVASKALENIGKYPQSTKDITFVLYASLAVIESSAIYALLISFMLISAQ